MHKYAQRLFAAMLALALWLSLGAMAVFASDENAYIYQYPDENNKPYYQMSMYAYKNAPDDKEKYPTGIFRILNTRQDDQVSDAYCADSSIYDEYGSLYKLVSLADNTTTRTNENKLRAIIHHSYPFVSAEDMIGAMEADGVTLHQNEIPYYEMVLITAVQQTIYSYTNPETPIQVPFAGGVPRTIYDLYAGYIVDFENGYNDTAVQKAYTYLEQDIPAVIQWLKGLEEEAAPQEPACSVSAQITADHTGYTLTLSNLSAELGKAGDLRVSVSVNGVPVVDQQSVTPDDEGNIQIPLAGEPLTPQSTAVVTVEGTQTYEDAVAYVSRAEDGSQPFIGWQTVERTLRAQADNVPIPEPAVIEITPADITIYMGGEDGYDAVVDGSDEVVSTNSLPRPLFYLEGPSGVDVDKLTFSSTDEVPGSSGVYKQWVPQLAGQDRDGKALYYLNKVHEAQDEVRVQYSLGDDSFVSDQFDPSAVQDLYEDYTISIYAGAVSLDKVTATAQGDPIRYAVRSNTGTLRVRAVENGDHTPQTNPVYHVQTQAPATMASGTAAVVAPEGTKYTLNHTTVDAPAAGVGLLFDDIYDKDNGQDDRESALIAQTDAALGPVEEGWTRFHQAKYLDLVDTNNGNAWVKTVDQAVTVYWAYPEGTDANTQFQLLHFENLHRDNADNAYSGYDTDEILAVTPTAVQITNTEAGICFSVPSGGFSPFVLVWQVADPPEGGLAVSKKVEGTGGDTGRSWNFAVTLNDNSVNGTYGEMNFVNGTASFTLKSGESKTALGLPAGLSYNVTEAEANTDGYTTTSTGSSGTIVKDSTVAAAFVNHRDAPAAQEPTPAPAEEVKTTPTPAPAATPEPTPTPSGQPLPQTGDSSAVGLWGLLGSLALIALAVILLIKARKFGGHDHE